MTEESSIKIKTSFQQDLEMVNDLAYSKCDFALSNLKWNAESTDYGACSFNLNGKVIQHRASKITATKPDSSLQFGKETLPEKRRLLTFLIR